VLQGQCAVVTGERWDPVLAINPSSVFHAVQAALPAMKAKNRGRIVNIASTHGLVAACAFLCCDAAALFRGAAVPVDGAWLPE